MANILLKSLLSAVVTALILLVAKFYGPRLAGAVGGLPIVFAVSYILITAADRGTSQNFLVGGYLAPSPPYFLASYYWG
mgnify:CR=1 FL=1